MSIDYLAFDCDNHYYEAQDAFTRHVPAQMQPRCVQWADINGRKHHIVGGQLARAVVNPTWDPIAKPGAMYEYFRGNPHGRNPLEMLRDREPLPAEYMDRDARVSVIERQGLEGVWLFPTLGVLYEELLKHDIEAVKALVLGFNRWIEDDWGCNYKGKIFTAPYVTLADVDFACSELDWALAQGARVVVMRPAPAWTSDGPRSPADEMFDPFWARAAEAGITVVVHAGDSGYSTHGYTRDGFASGFSGNNYKPSVKSFLIERAAYDFLITLCYEKLFERFPNLRIASVENGSEFLPDLFRKLEQSKNRMPGYYAEDPAELFKRNVWINPFWEDDVNEVVEMMGANRVIFGSDWPHIEGMPQPLDYLLDVEHFDAGIQQKILRDNTLELNTLRPA
ncbi:MAG: amidohydrolase family protein [Myxococcota bacterium]